jgi:LCP family protein required for cell wall assembly
VLATIVGHDENTVSNLPKIYCLVTGQSQNLTDTIMLCSYDPKTQEASILSIPRDTFIGQNKTTANSYDKINALYQMGPEKTLQAVNKLTGLNIEYYLNIDTEALKQLVDSIGGVYFDVPINMDYDDPTQDLYIHLKAGYQLLDGDKAEQVVRFRHNNNGTSYPMEYGDNDLGRMKTQRNFIEAVIKKLATPSTLTKLPELIKIAEQNVTTNLDITKAKDYAPYAVEFNTQNLKTAVMPGTPQLFNNMWFYTQEKTETKKVIKELFGVVQNGDSEVENKRNSEIKIEILNGTADNSKLNELRTRLKDKRYNVVKTGITSSTSKTMIINRRAESNDVINSIKKDLNNVGIISSATNNSNVDITIIIGKDYK